MTYSVTAEQLIAMIGAPTRSSFRTVIAGITAGMDDRMPADGVVVNDGGRSGDGSPHADFRGIRDHTGTVVHGDPVEVHVIVPGPDLIEALRDQ